ncbi:AAA family ATPase [Micromonospora sp. STR1_7]|uniref:AAA family ATPase n=1 Tax=Micromonospora parastrephiae TaxID=2806101 RepID=A0ABS1XP88_9ACTN|nr:AAA family ATPase [Micromonospora parastrephiae]
MLCTIFAVSGKREGRGRACLNPGGTVLTGAPGAGKTTLLEALRHKGHVTVREAAKTFPSIMDLWCPLPPHSRSSSTTTTP